MNKFNKKLSFDGSRELETITTNTTRKNSRRISSTARLERERQLIRGSQANITLDPRLAAREEFSASFVGLAGVFIPIQNDFTQKQDDHEADDENATSDDEQQQQDLSFKLRGSAYRDGRHWNQQKREQVKRVRFVICTLALFGLALGLMSRLMLNVSIVEMVRKPEMVPSVDLPPNEDEKSSVNGEQRPRSSNENDKLLPTTTIISNDDPLLFAAEFGQQETQQPDLTSIMPAITTTQNVPSLEINTGNPFEIDEANETASTTTQQSVDEKENDKPKSQEIVNDDDGLRFDWSKQDINLILGALYIGYVPGIMLGGDLAQRFGAKYPMFFCIFGTALINLMTPFIARYSLNLLISSRILLGLIQGSLMPALYELFNRWLTPTESSIFAPMIKVSMPLGSLIGTIMPGLLARLQLAWPNLFYIGGALCLSWSLIWLFVATSLPHTNRFVGQHELNRIMRKKSAAFKIIEIPSPPTVRRRSSATNQAIEMSSASSKQTKPQAATQQVARRPTPWMRIITNPSVLALTLVKFTYNIGMDFIFLQLAVYLREAHSAPIETISYIASGSFLMQMLLISFVGWLAKVAVLKRAFGLSVTKWRKIFQGGSNILMACAYAALAFSDPNIELATGLVLAVAFFWMLGAGGESMVPYDLSKKFPASIVGFTHSVSISSGIALTAIIGLVLGENTDDTKRWAQLFYILASFLAIGGIVFILVLKAKPFLPGERKPKQQQASEEIPSIAADQMKSVNQQSRTAAKEREANSHMPNGMR